MTNPSPARGSDSKRRILVAPDSFKGTLAASAVAAALAEPLSTAGFRVEALPLADGGEGTAEALLAAVGGTYVQADAHDPVGRPIEARYALLADGTAVVETAAASGLSLVPESERDPEAASTRGTGELIAAAAGRAPAVLVAVGGSATTDGGRGALEAIAAAGGVGDTDIVCLCDVRTPWELAARVFAPQKGADEEAVARLSARLEALAAELPRDPRGVARTGAAGGLAGGLWATYGAELTDGARFVLDRAGFDERLDGAIAVITGEGRLDETTLAGKVVGEVARRAALRGMPVHVVVGEDASTAGVRRALDVASLREAASPGAIASAAVAVARELA